MTFLLFSFLVHAFPCSFSHSIDCGLISRRRRRWDPSRSSYFRLALDSLLCLSCTWVPNRESTSQKDSGCNPGIPSAPGRSPCRWQCQSHRSPFPMKPARWPPFQRKDRESRKEECRGRKMSGEEFFSPIIHQSRLGPHEAQRIHGKPAKNSKNPYFFGLYYKERFSSTPFSLRIQFNPNYART